MYLRVQDLSRCFCNGSSCELKSVVAGTAVVGVLCDLDMTPALGYHFSLCSSLGQSAPSLGAFGQARVAGYKIMQMINRKPVINVTSGHGKILQEVKGGIELVDVGFSYPSRPGVMVFKNFSLSIAPGKTVAIVGSSGSGKSTLISLLERFYDPLSGAVRFATIFPYLLSIS